MKFGIPQQLIFLSLCALTMGSHLISRGHSVWKSTDLQVKVEGWELECAGLSLNLIGQMGLSFPRDYNTSERPRSTLTIRLREGSVGRSLSFVVNCFQVVMDKQNDADIGRLVLPNIVVNALGPILGEAKAPSFSWVFVISDGFRSFSYSTSGTGGETYFRIAAKTLFDNLIRRAINLLKEGNTEGITILRQLPCQRHLLGLLDESQRHSALKSAYDDAQTMGSTGEALLKVFSFLIWRTPQSRPTLAEVFLAGAWLEEHRQLDVLRDLLEHPQFSFEHINVQVLEAETKLSLKLLHLLLPLFGPTEIAWTAAHAISRHAESPALSLFELCLSMLGPKGISYLIGASVKAKLNTLSIDNDSWSKASPLNDYLRLLIHYYPQTLTLLVLGHEQEEVLLPSRIREMLTQTSLLWDLLGAESQKANIPLLYSNVEEWQQRLRVLDYFLMITDGSIKIDSHAVSFAVSIVNDGLVSFIGGTRDDQLSQLVDMDIPYVLGLWLKEQLDLGIDFFGDLELELKDLARWNKSWRSLAVVSKYLRLELTNESRFSAHRQHQPMRSLEHLVLNIQSKSVATICMHQETIKLGIVSSAFVLKPDAALVFLQSLAYIRLGIPLWLVERVKEEYWGMDLDFPDIEGLLHGWIVEHGSHRPDTDLPSSVKVACLSQANKTCF